MCPNWCNISWRLTLEKFSRFIFSRDYFFFAIIKNSREFCVLTEVHYTQIREQKMKRKQIDNEEDMWTTLIQDEPPFLPFWEFVPLGSKDLGRIGGILLRIGRFNELEQVVKREDIDADDLESILFEAIEDHNERAMDIIVEHVPDVEFPNDLRRDDRLWLVSCAPVHIFFQHWEECVEEDDLILFKICLERFHAQQNVIDATYEKFKSIWHEIFHYQNASMLKLVLDSKMDPNLNSALNNLILSKTLLDPTKRNMIHLLLEYKADPNFRDMESISTLGMDAVTHNVFPVLQLLVQYGLDLNLPLKNEEGLILQTCLDCAFTRKRGDMILWILERGGRLSGSHKHSSFDLEVGQSLFEQMYRYGLLGYVCNDAIRVIVEYCDDWKFLS